MKDKTFIVAPTKMAAQLSALTQRPAIFKQQPVLTVNGRPA